MSTLTCKVPRASELCNLDSFDLAFLTMTGHVQWVDWFDLSFQLVRKAVEEKLWGPESALLGNVLSREWRKLDKEIGISARLIGAFDRSGDISVNTETIAAVISDARQMGPITWELIKERSQKIVDAVVERATEYFRKQREEALKVEAEFEDIAKSINVQTGIYTQKTVQRVVHPEVRRLVKIVKTNPAYRHIDRAALLGRIDAIAKVGPDYLKTMSDVQVGRAWSFTGIEMAHGQAVTEYQVISEWDARTCPVCKRLHGRHFSVQQTYTRMKNVLKQRSPDKISGAMPFPRVKDVDNKSPKQIRSSGYCPPFHGRCRCDIVMLWRKTKEPKGERTRPLRPFLKPEAATQQKSDFIERFKGPSNMSPNELKDATVKKLAKRIDELGKEAVDDFMYFSNKLPPGWQENTYDAVNEAVKLWAKTSADTDLVAVFMQKMAKAEFKLSKASTSHFTKVALEMLEARLKGVNAARAMRGARIFLREMYNETQAFLKAEGIKEITMYRGMVLSDRAIGNVIPGKLKKLKKQSEERLKKLQKEYSELKEESKKLTMKARHGLTPAEEKRLLQIMDTELEATFDAQAAERFVLDKIVRDNLPAGARETVSLQPMSSFSADYDIAKSFSGHGQGTWYTNATVKVPIDRIISTPASGIGCLNEAEFVVLGGVEDVGMAAVRGGISSNKDWMDALQDALKGWAK